MFEALKTYRNFYLVAVLVLFLSFAFDFFGAITPDEFVYNYKSSEALVTNEVACKGQLYAGQLAEQKGGYSPSTFSLDCNPSQLTPYSSQFGLQGRAYTLGYRVLTKAAHLGIRSYIAVAQLVTALLSAAILGLLALWVRARFTLFAASTFTLLLALSPMIVGFSRNLYWALPLFYAPFVAMLYYYDPKRRGRKALWVWLVVGFLVYLKFLCGYEYVTSFAIMLMAVTAYFLYLARATRLGYLKQFIIAGIVSVLAFGAALATHVYALNAYTGSTSKSIATIKKRAFERTVNADKYTQYAFQNVRHTLGGYYDVSNTYFSYELHSQSKSEASATAVNLVNYALLPLVHIPVTLNQPFAVFAQSLTVVILLLIYLYRKRFWLQPALLGEVNALYVAMLFGLLGYLSWMIFAHPHSLVHAHINGILMYLPFAIFAYIALALYLEAGLLRFKKIYKKK